MLTLPTELQFMILEETAQGSANDLVSLAAVSPATWSFYKTYERKFLREAFLSTLKDNFGIALIINRLRYLEADESAVPWSLLKKHCEGIVRLDDLSADEMRAAVQVHKTAVWLASYALRRGTPFAGRMEAEPEPICHLKLSEWNVTEWFAMNSTTCLEAIRDLTVGATVEEWMPAAYMTLLSFAGGLMRGQGPLLCATAWWTCVNVAQIHLGMISPQQILPFPMPRELHFVNSVRLIIREELIELFRADERVLEVVRDAFKTDETEISPELDVEWCKYIAEVMCDSEWDEVLAILRQADDRCPPFPSEPVRY